MLLQDIYCGVLEEVKRPDGIKMPGEADEQRKGLIEVLEGEESSSSSSEEEEEGDDQGAVCSSACPSDTQQQKKRDKPS